MKSGGEKVPYSVSLGLVGSCKNEKWWWEGAL